MKGSNRRLVDISCSLETLLVHRTNEVCKCRHGGTKKLCKGLG